ncbi:hypothetical protein EZS27_008822 [termite gut metagenome]|uniref:Uncharacterized protein n=1 Tax=termite gut metagenome TaxID=433724 RepID=A0A5J4SBV9_9ZZZZ
MKLTKITFALLLSFIFLSAFSITKKNKQVYVFGVSASFTDTIVYYTDIQLLDSIELDKQGFLPHRELYSYQLKNYLEYQKNALNQTCMIYFSTDKTKLNKEAIKLLNRYKKNKIIIMERIESSGFQFKKPEGIK